MSDREAAALSDAVEALRVALDRRVIVEDLEPEDVVGDVLLPPSASDIAGTLQEPE